MCIRDRPMTFPSSNRTLQETGGRLPRGIVTPIPVPMPESLLRNCDGLKVTEKDVDNLASWNANNPGSYEIPFTVARIVLQLSLIHI